MQSGIGRPGVSRRRYRGVAPNWLAIDAAAFLSDRGDLTGRIEVEYDQRITNRWIAREDKPKAPFYSDKFDPAWASVRTHVPVLSDWKEDYWETHKHRGQPHLASLFAILCSVAHSAEAGRTRSISPAMPATVRCSPCSIAN